MKAHTRRSGPPWLVLVFTALLVASAIQDDLDTDQQPGQGSSFEDPLRGPRTGSESLGTDALPGFPEHTFTVAVLRRIRVSGILFTELPRTSVTPAPRSPRPPPHA